MRSPGFKFTAPIFLSYHFCWHASATDWACTSHRAVLNVSCMEATYTSICLAEASLKGALLLLIVGEDKVDLEPRPMSEQQVVWNIPGNCGSGGIIGVHYFSQMRWPVGFIFFFPASQSCA